LIDQKANDTDSPRDQHVLPATGKQKETGRDCQTEQGEVAGSQLLPIGAQESAMNATLIIMERGGLRRGVFATKI